MQAEWSASACCAALTSGSQLSRGSGWHTASVTRSAIVMVPLKARMIFFSFLQPMRQALERVYQALLKQQQSRLNTEPVHRRPA